MFCANNIKNYDVQKREPMEMLKLSILIPNVYQQRKDSLHYFISLQIQ